MVKKFKKIDVELDVAYNKVMNWFFSFPNKEMSLNNLAQELEISKTTANRIVTQLVSEGFLTKEVLGKTWRIKCNLEHSYNFTQKIIYNLARVFEAYRNGLRDDILKIVGNTKSIILFGSYRKGDDLEKSDIDIAVEVSNNEEVKIINAGIFTKFGYRKNVPINLYIFSRNKIDLNLFSNIANGILLEGFLEVRP